jgi:hypothetical protein
MLRCDECGREREPDDVGAPLHTRPWRAYITADNETAVFCPDCAQREFGPDESNDSTESRR